MRICRRSARISLVLTLALGVIPATQAQTVAGSPPSPPPADARAKAASEGDAAMERLKQAVSAQKGLKSSVSAASGRHSCRSKGQV